jgi:hypothetical protein
MKYIFTLLSVLFFIQTQAQQPITVKGNAKTDDGKGLQKATVLLYYPGERDTIRAITSAKGEFSFSNVKAKRTGIIISYIGYKKFDDVYDNTSAKGEAVIPDIIMTPGDNLLETVTVESSRIQIKEDTVGYKIDSTMFRKNDNIETMIKNLPGVEVDKDGKITAQGKEVTKVKVNGKEFFGGDVKTATRDLNADMVDKIQFADDYGDQAALSGVKDGEPTKTMNIVLKKDKNKGNFGSVSGGAGTTGRYTAGFALNRFKGNKQISVNGNINNTNANTFDFSGLQGGMGAIAGSMMRSFGVGTGGAGIGSFFGGNNNGVGVTKSLGFNYRDEWSPKISAYGSYSYSRKSNNILNEINQQNIQQDSLRSFSNNQNNTDYSVTDNHRFSFNVEYKIDSFNYIKFNPNFTYRQIDDTYRSDFANYNYKGAFINNGFNTDLNNSETPNFSGSLLYNHRFHKKGRNFSLNFSGGNSVTDAEDDILNAYTNPVSFTINQFITQQNQNKNYSVNASYNEQLSKKRSLEFNYTYSKRNIDNDKETFAVNNGSKILVDSLTNIYENIYTTNRFGINLRTAEKKYNYSVGLAVQPATIESNSFTNSKISYKQNLVNYFPVARFNYNFSRSKTFGISYNGSTNQPTYQQSQPVYDFSNRQNIVIGNPDLNPEFINSLNIRYNNVDFVSGNVFFGSLNGSFTKDKIVSNVIPKNFGQLETRYLNADGFYNLTGYYNISKPIKSRKYVFNLGGNATFNNNISYLNFVKNKGKNFVFGQRFSMDYKLKKWLETTGSFNFSLNDTKYSLTSTNNNTTKTYSIYNSTRLFFKHDFIFSYDLNKIINKGFGNNVTSNPFIVNSSLEKLLLKKKTSSVKLQAFDLLNQNTTISRNVTGNSITDSRTNRLGRYFMMTFIFRFNKFSGTQPAGNQMMPGGGGMRMGGPPMPGM